MGGQAASTLRELAQGLETCSDESIYHHTIVAIRNQLALTDNLANDFARWARNSLKREDLASHLATADMKDCQTIGDLRGAFCEIVRAYLEACPEAADEAAENPFYFCEGMEVAVPLRSTARTLEEFRQCVQEMSGESFYLHFVAPRTRREMQSNDFSMWLEKSLGLSELAAKINDIDVMDSTLDGAKERILELLDAERAARLKAITASN
jgi:hypothetical protein